MEIRLAMPGDVNEVKDLWQYTFMATPQYTEWYFSNIYRNENTVVVEDNRRIVASMQLVTYYLRLWGDNVPITLVCGIAIPPQERGKGHITNLLKRAINIALSRGQTLILLQPDNFSFYRRYGWENCYDREIMSGDISALLPYSKIGGTFVPCNRSSRLDEIFSKYCFNKNAYVMRSERNWMDIFSHLKLINGRSYLLEEGGYIMYSICPETSTFKIHEIAYQGVEQLSMLFDFIYSHGGQVGKWEMVVPCDNIVNLTICEKNINVRREPFCMARALNPQKILDKLLRYRGFEYDISIEIRDAFIPSNNTTIKNSISGRNTSMDIKTFTRLALGYISLEEAQALRYVQGDIASLNGLFAKEVNYLNVEFY